jgi:hypothetical protein
MLMSETVTYHGADASRGLARPLGGEMQGSSAGLGAADGQAGWVQAVIDMSRALARIQVSLQELVSTQRELVDLYGRAMAEEEEDVKRVRDMLRGGERGSLTS